MTAFTIGGRPLTPLAWIAVPGLGLLAAVLVLALPDRSFAALVEGLGLPALIDSARPPLGTTARALAALAAGLAGAGAAYLALRLLAARHPDDDAEAHDTLLLADAHPDPVAPVMPEATAPPGESETIAALLERLECAVGRHAAPSPRSLEETLDRLRQLAIRRPG